MIWHVEIGGIKYGFYTTSLKNLISLKINIANGYNSHKKKKIKIKLTWLDILKM